MDGKDYESTEFYSYKFKNFSTMIIIPMTILALILIVGSFFATRQSTVTSIGIVEPQNRDCKIVCVRMNDSLNLFL